MFKGDREREREKGRKRGKERGRKWMAARKRESKKKEL